MAKTTTFTGSGSANTAGNWNNGLPSRAAGDTAQFTTFPTGGTVSAATFVIPALAANLHLLTLDVGEFQVTDASSNQKRFANEQAIYFAGSSGSAKYLTILGYVVGFDITNTGGQDDNGATVSFQAGLLDTAAILNDGASGTNAGGTFSLDNVIDEAGGNWVVSNIDGNPFLVLSGTTYGLTSAPQTGTDQGYSQGYSDGYSSGAGDQAASDQAAVAAVAGYIDTSQTLLGESGTLITPDVSIVKAGQIFGPNNGSLVGTLAGGSGPPLTVGHLGHLRHL